MSWAMAIADGICMGNNQFLKGAITPMQAHNFSPGCGPFLF
jgi:hypothetical protein